ncbi:hypothetical protein D9758_011329 [Tetrapyrgos nigripes]|uniref:Uncharacterized protein n=1 Tax=Tetrapyrgos nigripes TaxID=182062 RepID=A0A8H5LK87_9AGAR|nr:hypothetical protein D9758_011329 [Tetrapyrgos nigripes]
MMQTVLHFAFFNLAIQVSGIWCTPISEEVVTIGSRAGGVTVIDDGSNIPTGQKRNQGNLSNGWLWQNTGLLTHGCTDSGIHISDCYGMQLSSKTNENLERDLPPGATPRQRIEIASGQRGVAGETHSLSPRTGTANGFFHLMQLLNENPDGKVQNGPVITLDARNGRVYINDFYSQGCSGSSCPSMPFSSFAGHTTLHRATVTYGHKGYFLYTIQDADSGKQLLKYEVHGIMGTGGPVKFGTYRAAVLGMTASYAAVGDFKQLS